MGITIRKNFKIMLTALIIILLFSCVGAYFYLMPHYKEIELNGYTMEVPQAESNITVVNDNYKKYDDKTNNITIKSYAINNVNQTNYTGAWDVGYQIGLNSGQNSTIENKTVLNKSGNYTYYDISNYQMIVITSNNYESMAHILKSLNKTDITPNANTKLDLRNISNNTTDDNNTTVTTKATSKKTKKSSSSADDGYHYSMQYGTYIKEWTDSDGVSHMKSRDGQWRESYDERTGILKSKSPYGYEEYDMR